MSEIRETPVDGTKQWNPEKYDGKHSFVWRHGVGVIELLDPKPGEHILDLGCGTGHLTNRIAELGATVVGIDTSRTMIDQARQNYPALRFELGDGRSIQLEQSFDAVFSNAAIHWMTDQDAVARSVWRALKPGGRFVAEFGGKGNIFNLHSGIRAAVEAAGFFGGDADYYRYYPTIGEYSTLLESAGFAVTYAIHFDRPTPLEGGESGLRNWISVFADNFLARVPAGRLDSVIADIEARLRSRLFRDGAWYADYRRIRISANRPL
jgi:trans-aconitate methyltransferase